MSSPEAGAQAPRPMQPGGLSLCPASPGDEAFFFELFFQTRKAGFAALGWEDGPLRAFLQSQYAFQQTHYKGSFPGAEVRKVLLDGQAIGRMDTQLQEDALHLVDIALMPERQGQGLGSHLMGLLLERADAAGLPIDLQVEAFNPAQRLYLRLGFQQRDSDGVYLTMRRPPRVDRGPAARQG